MSPDSRSGEKPNEGAAPPPTHGRVEGGKAPAGTAVRETTAQQLHPGAEREGGQEAGHRGQRPG